MLRVTVQSPPDPDAALMNQVRGLAQDLAIGDHDEVIEQPGAAPANTFSLTVHVLPDPAVESP